MYVSTTLPPSPVQLNCSATTCTLQSKFETLRRQDRQKREKDKSASIPDKSQRFIEASQSVLGPMIEKIKPLFEAKMWDELRYMSISHVTALIGYPLCHCYICLRAGWLTALCSTQRFGRCKLMTSTYPRTHTRERFFRSRPRYRR